MARNERPAAPARTERPHAPPAERQRAGDGKTRYYGILQGDVVELVESATPPDLTVKGGERMKRVLFSTTLKEKADKLFAMWKARARGIVGKGEAH